MHDAWAVSVPAWPSQLDINGVADWLEGETHDEG